MVQNTPPAWTARNGEFVFFSSGTVKRLYFYNISSWDYLQYNLGGTQTDIKAWITFSGTGALQITDSYNVTALTRTATGNFEITLDTDYLNGNFTKAGANGDGVGQSTLILSGKANSSGSLDIIIDNDAGADTDPNRFHVMSTGDQ